MELQICTSICQLSKQPQNRSSIVKDQGCLPGLVLFLDNADTRVTATALEAMTNLADHIPNRKFMRDELGMLFSLRKIVSEGPIDLAKVAKELLETITTPESAVPLMEKKTIQGSRTPLTSINVNNRVARESNPSTPRGQSLFASKTNKKRSRTLTIQITKGFDNPECQSLITQKLLQIKGIVSFTFDSNLQRAIIRVTQDVKAEAICSAITDTKVLEARQIVRNKDGGEIVLSFGKKPSPVRSGSSDISADSKMTASDTTNNARAFNVDEGYLDDEEVEDEKMTSEQANMAVATWGTAGNMGAGWIGEVGGYLAKALYW